VTWSRAPAHLLAASLCLGLALANLTRLHTIALAGSVLAAVAVIVADAPATRLALAAVLLCAAGWWWASTRLDALDRSPMLAQVGRAGRGVTLVTAPPTRGRFGIRAHARLRRFEAVPVGERVELELPLGRSPPQGAVLDVLALVKLPRGPHPRLRRAHVATPAWRARRPARRSVAPDRTAWRDRWPR
jgi:hypothetical protein